MESWIWTKDLAFVNGYDASIHVKSTEDAIYVQGVHSKITIYRTHTVFPYYNLTNAN